MYAYSLNILELIACGIFALSCGVVLARLLCCNSRSVVQQQAFGI